MGALVSIVSPILASLKVLLFVQELRLGKMS